MIYSAAFSRIDPAKRADLIYRSAQADVSSMLWQAALGKENELDAASGDARPDLSGSNFNSLVASLCEGARQPVEGHLQSSALSSSVTGTADSCTGNLRIEGLGPNRIFGASITRAAERTGLPAAALASIVDAEAGKRADGCWNAHSRNPRSSAAGLGQFLSSTWEGEAERKGTYLNCVAAKQGWLDAAGHVKDTARSSLLALRYDAGASIEAIADYAAQNVLRLRRSGVKIGDSVSDVAKLAYLGHHLGPADAVKFLHEAIPSHRAQLLLSAQVGTSEANRRIAEAGDAAGAHRVWLNSYVDHRIKPDKYIA
jgi:hypothetical protein